MKDIVKEYEYDVENSIIKGTYSILAYKIAKLGKEWDYKDETSYRFSLTKGEKIIFSIRKILGNKEEYTRNLDIDK